MPAPLPVRNRVAALLRRDTTAGVLLLAATLLALILSNSPASPLYAGVRDTVFGPAALHLDLTLGTWAADGLLAIFFFVVGLELKQEFVTGRLRDPRAAVLPIVAAAGGVALPALLYTLVNLRTGGGALTGWAIPAATDIAFAVAVLAVVGHGLPPALRTFLLTLAVVDDLLAITIIAVFYTAGIAFLPLLLAVLPIAGFSALVRRGVRAWWLLIPLAVLAWALVHASGIHATIAGVVLGLAVPAVATGRSAVQGPTGTVAATEHLAHRWGPLSAAVAVPVFAFFSAGVHLGGLSGLASALTDPVALGVLVALVVGKPLGITGATFLLTRLPGIRLDPSLRWGDVLGMSCVAGIGFTVSLLVGELAFGPGSLHDDHAKVGILLGSLLSALLGAVLLRRRAAAPGRVSP
ncbi:Na+/H+ antiporter NhaA [Brachybacterium sp. AOP25-B2-12]|uniref:Na+/H+ antiporter NhaA n=1 Tax=Brachybacterium sp. AOP25-B2-12 TaxID=3457710 RepID=UPI0040343E15